MSSNGTVTITARVDAAQAQQALVALDNAAKQIKVNYAAMVQVQNANAAAITGNTQAIARQNAELREQASVYGSVRSNMAGVVAQLALIAGGVVALRSLSDRGIEYNRVIQDAELSIAAIVASNEIITNQQGQQVDGAQKLMLAQSQVAAVVKELAQDAIKSKATLPEMVAGYTAAVGPVMRLGGGLEDARKVTVGMIRAMGAMNIPLAESRTQIAQILNGHVSIRSPLAVNLGITNAMLKSWKEQGTTIAELEKKLENYSVAGEMAARNWDGAWTSFSDNASRTLGITMKGTFDEITDQMNSLNDHAFGKDMQENAAHVGAIIQDGVSGAIEEAKVLGKVLLTAADGWVKIMDEARMAGANLANNPRFRAEQRDIFLGNNGFGSIARGAKQASNDLAHAFDPVATDEDVIAYAKKMGLRGDQISRLSSVIRASNSRVEGGVSSQLKDISSGYLSKIDAIHAPASTKGFNFHNIKGRDEEAIKDAARAAKHAAADQKHLGEELDRLLPTLGKEGRDKALAAEDVWYKEREKLAHGNHALLEELHAAHVKRVAEIYKKFPIPKMDGINSGAIGSAVDNFLSGKKPVTGQFGLGLAGNSLDIGLAKALPLNTTVPTLAPVTSTKFAEDLGVKLRDSTERSISDALSSVATGDFSKLPESLMSNLQSATVDGLTQGLMSSGVGDAVSSLGASLAGPAGIAVAFGSILAGQIFSASQEANKKAQELQDHLADLATKKAQELQDHLADLATKYPTHELSRVEQIQADEAGDKLLNEAKATLANRQNALEKFKEGYGGHGTFLSNLSHEVDVAQKQVDALDKNYLAAIEVAKNLEMNNHLLQVSNDRYAAKKEFDSAVDNADVTLGNMTAADLTAKNKRSEIFNMATEQLGGVGRATALLTMLGRGDLGQAEGVFGKELADGFDKLLKAIEKERVGSSPQNPSYTIVVNQKDNYAFTTRESYFRGTAPDTRRADGRSLNSRSA